MENVPESCQPYLSFANMLVSILVAAQLALAIVQMDDLDLFEANCGVKGCDCCFIARRSAKVVARGENVARVEAHAETLALTATVDESRNLFESMSHAIGVTGGGLDQYSRAKPSCCIVHRAQSVRYAFYARVFTRSSV